MARRLLSVVALLHLAVASPLRGEDGVLVRAGETRAGDLVVLGRGAVVEGVLSGTLVAVGGSVRVAGRVEKDLVTFGGSVVLEKGAEVRGDLLSVGGSVSSPAGAETAVRGRVLTVGAVEAAFAAELQTSPLSARPASGLLLAFRLVLLFLWLVVGLLLLRFLPRPVSAAAGLVPGRVALVGAVGAATVLSAALLSAFLLLVLPASAGLVLAGLIVALLGVAKAFGLAVVFVAVGRRLTRAARRGSPLFGDPAALAVGLALLGLLSLVPTAGPLLWAVVSLLAIGAALLAAARRDALQPAF
ncbi:MAG: hypothetical protein U0529_02880 [Thermoanaerobaculia bacterium]